MSSHCSWLTGSFAFLDFFQPAFATAALANRKNHLFNGRKLTLQVCPLDKQCADLVVRIRRRDQTIRWQEGRWAAKEEGTSRIEEHSTGIQIRGSHCGSGIGFRGTNRRQAWEEVGSCRTT